MPPIGETLREARMRQRLDIGDVEERTKIRAKYLRALENEEWGLLPGPTFVKTFLRTYAEVVGIDPHLLVEEYRTKHEAREEPDALQPLTPAVRSERRQPRAPGPPGPGVLAAGLVVLLIAFLLILGLVGGEDDGDRAADPPQETETTAARPAKKPKKKKPAPAPRGVTVRISPSVATYVCLDAGEGSDRVFEGILEDPRTFKNAKELRINLGKRSVGLRANGKEVRIAQSPEPLGLRVTKAGAREIGDGPRPCA